MVLAAEGLLLGAVSVAMVYALWAVVPRSMHPKSGPRQEQAFRNPALAMAIPIAVVAGGIAAAFIAGSPLKGQAVAAAVVGGIAAGAAIRLFDLHTPVPAMFVAIAALATLGPLSGVVMAGSGVVSATYRGTLFPLAWILPLDWIAGGLLGIPLGVAWAASMMEKKKD